MSKVIDSFRADLEKARTALAAHDARHAPLVAARDKLQHEFEPKLQAMNAELKAANLARGELQEMVTRLTLAVGTKKAHPPVAEAA